MLKTNHKSSYLNALNFNATFIMVITILTLFMSGCVSLNKNNIKDIDTGYDDAQTDVIRNFGYPMYQGVRQKGMVLMGDNYSYLISSGDVDLERLMTLNAHNVQLKQPILIDKYPDNSVKITLNVTYIPSSDNLNTIAQSDFRSLCLNNNTKVQNLSTIQSNMNFVYECQLHLEGGMYQPLATAQSRYKLDNGVAAVIRTLNKERLPNQAEVGVVPRGMVIEAINIPLQLLMIGKNLGGL